MIESPSHPGGTSPPAWPTAGAGRDDRGLGAAWLRFWFEPANPRPLALVRILTGILGLLLLWSYASDLQAWFGPDGMVPEQVAAAWRPRWGVSLYDLATTSAALQGIFSVTVAAFVALLLGLGTRLATVAAAILWASLLHRGPMLAGPADDCLAVLLWCLAVGPSGHNLSIDRWLAARAGRPPPGSSSWARVSLRLLQVHASAITLAAILAQLKGDAWWNGTAAWWLAARAAAVGDAAGLYARSEYLMNLVTHAIVAFEILFAVGLWFAATRQTVARTALVVWPVIGMLAGEPLWGFAMAIFAVPLARVDRSESPGARGMGSPSRTVRITRRR